MTNKTIVSELARSIQNDLTVKYTSAIRYAEFQILLGGEEAYRPGGKFGDEVEDVLPVLREIRPVRLTIEGVGEGVFTLNPDVGFGFLPDYGGIGFLNLKEVKSLKGDLSQYYDIAGVYFGNDDVGEDFFDTQEEFEEYKKENSFDRVGVPAYDQDSSTERISDRVLVSGEGESTVLDSKKGVRGSDFCLISTSISTGHEGTFRAYHMDLRGLDYKERVSLITDTFNSIHAPKICVEDVLM